MSGADCRSSRANPRIRPLKTVAKGDEGALYHVIVRGNHRRDIFGDPSDRVAYLDRIEHYRERYRCIVYAYVC
jgi:REP element-mobilizing transposase RayT